MSEKIINLYDFQAANDTESFAMAMAYLRENPSTTLIVPPGTYEITSELARNAQHSVMTGEWGANPQRIMFNPHYKYTRGISLEGQQGSRIFAEGAKIIIDGFMEAISLINCSDIEIAGVTIDHKRKPYSRGKVREIQLKNEDGLRECIIEFDDDCPIYEKTPLTLRHIFFDTVSGKNIYAGLKSYTYIDAHHIKAQLNNADMIHDGVLYYTVHSFHSRPAILIENARDIKLTDVTIHSQPGMGIVGNRSENITITRLSVIPSAGHHMSTDTDATHFTSIKGLLRFDNCVFEGQGDDFTNVHGYYQAIIGKEAGNTYYLQEKTPDGTHAQSLDYPDIGDTMELTNRDTLEILDTFTVLDCTPMPNEWMCKVTLDHALPEITEELMIADITRLPRLEIVNCTASHHFARSILIKTRGALIENNTFRDIQGPAIVAAAESWWYEGVCPADITIRGNHITNCAELWGEAAGIVVKADSNNPKGCSIYNVIIENNVIDAPSKESGIFVRNTNGLIIRGNDINTKGQKIVVESCSAVQIM